MNKILLIFFSLIFGANVVLAQQDPQISFPISELGNCNNVQTCKVYCDQIENRESCIAFARSKGLYKTRVSEQKAGALSLAKTELGCDSITSCKALCQQKENQPKCQTFAQKHGLVTAPSVKDEELLTKAKQNLNCASFEECKALCDQQDNYTKCATLLQDQVTQDERAMFEKYKPQIKEFLGCDSMITCMAFCINPTNSAKCAELGSKIGGSQIPNQETPEVWCPKISLECKWDGANCVCDGPQSCSQNPGCSWNGQFCSCNDTPTTINESPEVWCPKAGPGCSWDGNQCACFEPGTLTQTDILPPPSPEPGEIWCPKAGTNCSWDNKQCICGENQTKDFANPTTSPIDNLSVTQGGETIYKSECLAVGCRWSDNPNSCDCAGVGKDVQGVTTNRGLLKQLLDFIFR